MTVSRFKCFKCGESMVSPSRNELDQPICIHCLGRSVVDFQAAVDILMEVYDAGNLPEHLREYLDEVEYG